MLRNMRHRLLAGFGGMTIPTVEFDAGIAVTSGAKVFFAGSHTATLLAGMALDTLFQAVLSGTNTLAHRFITMMLEQFHMITAHERCVFHALIAFALFQLGQIHTRRRRE